MSAPQPDVNLAGPKEIGHLHDALDWTTTPGPDDCPPETRGWTIRPCDLPGELEHIFPDVRAEVGGYMVNAMGKFFDCDHYMNENKPCLNLSLAQIVHGAKITAKYKLFPVGTAENITHCLSREMFYVPLGRLLLDMPPDLRALVESRMATPSLEYPRFNQTWNQIYKLPEVPTAYEVSALIDILVGGHALNQSAAGA